MSLVVKDHSESKAFFGRRVRMKLPARRLKGLGVYAVIIAGLSTVIGIYWLGRPLMAIWAGLALIGWLFISGAGRASGADDERSRQDED